ncbi:MAG: RAD55 family ATPase [Candidatus Nanohaloarchaea archaeon]
MGNDRVATGIDAFDEELEGGFPPNSTVIVMGEEGTGKDALVNKFIYHGLEEGEEAMYVTLDGAPGDVRGDAEYMGWDFTEYDDHVVFVDGYSWQGGGSDAEFALEGLSDLNQMNMTFTDALNSLSDGQKRVTINSASTMLLYTDATSAVKFLQVVGAKASSSGGCLLITLEEGMHDDQTISTINHVADGVLKTRVDGDQNQISIERMNQTEHTREWMDLNVDSDEGNIDIEK